MNCKVISSFIYFPLESTTRKKKKEHKLFGRLQFTRSVNLPVKFGVLDYLPVENVIHNLFFILAQPVKREGVCVCVCVCERERETEREKEREVLRVGEREREIIQTDKEKA